MPRLKNTTDADITLATGHVIAAHKSLSVNDDTLRKAEGHNFSRLAFRRGELLVESDKEVVIEPTRTFIAGAKKADLITLLEGHGVGSADTTGKTADQLRELAVSVIFVETDEQEGSDSNDGV
jgi:hypothetical protein